MGGATVPGLGKPAVSGEEAELKAPLTPWAQPPGPAARGPTRRLGGSCCSPAQAVSGRLLQPPCRCVWAGSGRAAGELSPRPARPPWPRAAAAGRSWWVSAEGEKPSGVFRRGLWPSRCRGLGKRCGGFGGGQRLPSPHRPPGLWDACPGAGWCCGGWGAVGVRSGCATRLCCCFCPVSARRGRLLGGFPKPVSLAHVARRRCKTVLRLFPPIGAAPLRRTRAPAGKGQRAAAAVREKMSVSSALPFTPCLHQACLAQLGPMPLQNQHHPAPMEAWGYLAYATVTELATVAMSLWAAVVTTGYPRTAEAERPKPRAPSLPSHAVSALPARGSCPAL